MPSPTDAYREGYERGQKDTVGGRLADATMGMMRDDPGGWYAAGYADGAAGRLYKPHGNSDSKPRPQAASTATQATDLEKSWYRLCNQSEFIPEEEVARYSETLRAQGSHAAIVVGLSDFTAHNCPKCGKAGQFKIRFLGRLKHPECGWNGFMPSSSYVGHQITQILHSGIRAGGGMKEDADKKGDRPQGWFNAIFGFLITACFRALLAVVLVPVHAAVALSQRDQSQSDKVTRVAILIITAIVIVVLIYRA